MNSAASESEQSRDWRVPRLGWIDHSMLRSMFAVLFLATVLGAAPQSQPAGTELKSSPKSAPVLRLEGEDITWDEYSRWLIENFGVRLATTFAGDHLVEREARRRGVDVTPAEVETELDSQFKTRIDGAFLGSKSGWLAELARLQRSEPGVRTQRKQEIGIDILTRKSVAVNRVVPEDKIVREWELSYGRGGRAYDLSMLFVHCEFLSLDKEESKEIKDRMRQEELDVKQRRALELRQRIVNGGDFAAIAREASDDELSRTNGAKPRQPYRHYGWPKNFPEALDKLAVGEISQPIYAKGGWWVVRVDGLTVTPLEQVRAELVQRLEKIGPAFRSEQLTPQSDGSYVARAPTPDQGWTAFLVEIAYDTGGPHPLKVSSAVRILPDRLPFEKIDPNIHKR